MKKILCGIVALIMLLATMIPASANNITLIAKDYEATPAISVLKSLGIVIGDEKGNLNLDKDITRAEFSTILLRLMGVSNAANTQTATVFEDVPSSHWASGVINYCYNSKIILGYGDNKFGPDDELTFEQAVKMIVCALGYEEMATSKGTYPAGYLTVATDIGLLENCDNSNARINIFTMCYNALDIPVMEQTGFGTDIKYEIMNKNNDHDKVTLLTKQNIYKLGGIVAANDKVAFKTDATVTDKGFVEFWWDYDFDSPVAAWAKKSKNEPNYANSGIYYGSEILETGNTDVANSLGNQINVYVKKNISKYTVLAYEIDETSTSMTIKADMIDDMECNFNSTPAYFKYFKTEDTNKSTKINLDFGYTVVWNNASKDTDYLQSNLTSNTDAVIELIDFNDNNKYDVVKVIAYDYKIVDEVSVSRGIIEDIHGNRINLDIENEDAKVSIVDELNNPISITDIEPTDVLAMIVNTTGSTDAALRTASYDSLDIIVLKGWYVEGTVNGVNDEEVVVDKTSYDMFDNCPDLGTEGIFYLNLMKTGIIDYEKDIIKANDYAYVLEAYYATNKDAIDNILTMSLVTDKGIYEYKLAEKVKIDGISTKVTEFADSWYDQYKDSPVATADDTAARMIKFELNSKDEIVKVITSKNTNNVDEDLNYTNIVSKPYAKDDVKLGTKYLLKSARVIKIDFIEPEKSKFVDVEYFVDENIYSALLFDVDEDGNYSAAAIYDSESVYADGAAVAIVKSVYKVNDENDEEVTKIVAYQNEQEITLYFDEYSTSGYGVETDKIDSLSFGSIILYSADGKGIVDKYDVVGHFNTETETFAFDADFNPTTSFEDGDAYFYGYIAKYGDNKLQVVVEDSKVDDWSSAKDTDVKIDDDVFVEALDLSLKGANQYTLTNKTKTLRKIEIGDYRLGNISNATEGIEEGKYEVYYVLIRTYEGKIVDIVSFDIANPTIKTLN